MYFSNLVNFIFFNFLESKLNIFFDLKIANNFTAFTHAFGSTILSLRYLVDKTSNNYSCLTSYSSAFFAYDILYLLRNWENKSINYAYLYHHTSSIFLMYQNPLIYKSGLLLFLGELSNLPSYFVYYYSKQPEKKKLVKKLKWTQFLLYSFIRVPLATKILSDVYLSKEANNLVLIAGIPIYLMGLIWTKKLYDKL